MRVLLFGATGMIGQGVLRECLLDREVESVLSVVRKPSGRTDRKVRELVHVDFQNFSQLQNDFAHADACLFCLGVTSAGIAEEEYRRITHDFALAAARACLAANPAMIFIYISGAGADSSEQGRTMWARVKGQTENEILKMPFRGAYVFRPGFIRAMHGIQSRTKVYRVLYKLVGPLMPLFKALAPRSVTSTEQLGRALLQVAKAGYATPVLEMRDITGF
jgi:uncharacterized protein YbjT (DUF2867 family)